MVWVYLALAVAGGVLGQLGLKLGVSQSGGRGGLLAAAHSPWLWLGLLAYGLSMLAWLQVLRAWPLGRAYLFLSLNFPLVVGASALLWHESVRPMQWIGLLLVLGGLACISLTQGV
jgi:multidrug transporter EmrE-like cation transporter